MNDRDVYFLNFFNEVIRDDLDRDSSSEHKESLKKIQSTQGETDRLCTYSSATRCAYIYQYAPCIASTLYSHLGHLMENNRFLLRRVILRQNFSVCCFCSGLSVEFLALTNLLDTTLRGCCPSEDYRARWTDVDFVIVNIDPSWTGTIEKMVKKLSDDLGDMSSVNLNLRILTAESSMPLTDDIKEVLSQSDLVTIVHFVNSSCGDERSARLNMIQDVSRFMPGGGVLFFLDTPHGICEALKENLESHDEALVDIYGPLNYCVHRMRSLCRKECIRLYSKQYGWRCCNLESVCYVRAWYKKTSVYFSYV